MTTFCSNLDMEPGLDLTGKQFYAYQRSMFNIMRGTLEYPATKEAKTRKLVDDILFFCRSVGGDPEENGFAFEVWDVILGIAENVPSQHDWQDALVETVETLRAREDTVLLHANNTSKPWKDLPDLNNRLKGFWKDPTDQREEHFLDPPDQGEDLLEFMKFENVNSFLVRLTSSASPWLRLPIWQLRIALEEPPAPSAAMSCRLWVATEWMIGCPSAIFQELESRRPLNQEMTRSLKTGALYKDQPPLSVERWKFWKRRFWELRDIYSELAQKKDAQTLDMTLTVRIWTAIASMDSVRT